MFSHAAIQYFWVILEIRSLKWYSNSGGLSPPKNGSSLVRKEFVPKEQICSLGTNSSFTLLTKGVKIFLIESPPLQVCLFPLKSLEKPGEQMKYETSGYKLHIITKFLFFNDI